PSVPTTEPTGGAPAPASSDPGPAPPFYNSPSPGDSAAPAVTSGPPSAASPEGGSQDAAPPNQSQKSTSPAPAGPALRVGIITGDAAQEAGFRAYVSRLNQAGGVRGRSIELVRVTPGAPAANTIATVNLSSQPVAGPGGAPGWATGPLLETLTATEDLLATHGAVFSFASPPERQGHLAADALFPSDAGAGTTAVIYVPPAPGPLRDAVPEAIKAVLKQRNVTNVQVVTYDPAAGKALTAADAAFVSLDPAAAQAWVAQAKAEGYRPPAGVAGIYSLADDTLAPDLPEGARVVSPYVAPAGDEGQAIRSAGAGTSAPVLHGWATAKSLAAAMWRTGADTPAEVQAALEGLAGWSSGLAPPYETRSGTRSRTPEGVVFVVQSQAFVAQGGFRRDPYPIQ
ncbi:MAG: ABC transporter substrate-binding protein, partial [Acidimicrobiia bacterium]